jgi:hypothetical protein
MVISRNQMVVIFGDAEPYNPKTLRVRPANPIWFNIITFYEYDKDSQPGGR